MHRQAELRVQGLQHIAGGLLLLLLPACKQAQGAACLCCQAGIDVEGSTTARSSPGLDELRAGLGRQQVGGTHLDQVLHQRPATLAND